MQAQKGPPGGRRRRPDSAITIDRCGTHGVPQHSELGCDAAHAPRGILRCQPVNQAARLQIDPHPAGLTAPALPAPVSAPDQPMPPDDGRRLNELQMRPPAGPVPRRDGPETGGRASGAAVDVRDRSHTPSCWRRIRFSRIRSRRRRPSIPSPTRNSRQSSHSAVPPREDSLADATHTRPIGF